MLDRDTLMICCVIVFANLTTRSIGHIFLDLLTRFIHIMNNDITKHFFVDISNICITFHNTTLL